MRFTKQSSLIILFLISVALASCIRNIVDTKPIEPAPPAGYGSLGALPFKEAWYGMYFHEDKVGFSHFKIEPSGENFVISSDSVMRLTAMKKTDEVSMKERVLVKPDLSLISFDSEVKMNNRLLTVKGTSQADKFLLEMNADGEKIHREYPIDQKIYHTSGISLMPALRGVKQGKSYSFMVFNTEKQELEKIEQSISEVKGDPGPHGAIWKITTNYGQTVVYSWLDKQAKAVMEKAMEGQLITVLEDEAAAKRFLEKKTAGKDLILDISLIKVTKPIKNPEQTKFVKLKIDGVEPTLVPEDHRQKKSLINDSKSFTLAITAEDLRKRKKDQANISYEDNPELSPYLKDTLAITSKNKEIIDQSNKIVKQSSPDLDKVTEFTKWTAKNIKGSMQDSWTAVSVLKNKEGECEAHSNLYAAFARAHGIPTRVVMGLVYSDDKGFLYHAWAESYVDGWLAVDPTFGQIPADATHIKLANGIGAEAVPSLIKMLGKTKFEVLEFR